MRPHARLNKKIKARNRLNTNKQGIVQPVLFHPKQKKFQISLQLLIVEEC